MIEKLSEKRIRLNEDFSSDSSSQGWQSNSMHDFSVRGESDTDDESNRRNDDEELWSDQKLLEEARRIFQMFAAKMFEQRVLTAFHQKLSIEKQEALIEEEEEERMLQERRRLKKQQKKHQRKMRMKQKSTKG
eukprot:TRINITY_DN12407_c0_g1_i12.p1 TRINITY_DN12407_c0_g1~~TRINITY_DN12407_c0_g1_i12.p1  ORF type:complete len:133 (+),score=30.95 TRINITY_DN12407_c0_g1_i12:972-1370(+)